MLRKAGPFCVQISAILILLSCSQSASAPQSSASTQGVSGTPTPDAVTQNYVALIHAYWIEYKTAEGDLDHMDNNHSPFTAADAARACFGLLKPPPNTFSDVRLVDPPTCRARAAAMALVHEKFLRDLSTTPAPPMFASDDQAFRSQLPKAIVDVKAMIAAAKTGNQQAVLQSTTAYVNDMMPTVTDALDGVDPSVVHG